MNFYRLITLVILISATSAYASQSSVELYERFDDIRVVAVINIEDINNSPIWNPGFDPLPLSVDGAIQSIRDFIKQPNLIGAIEEIEIRTIKNHPGHWHYLFKVSTNDTNSSGYKMYAVLMNGKVIPAFIQPDAIK
ncbi:hypothetical protein N9164_09820 [Draconibacterium sp.]|nr:hypothetical protein [Draconibacterium sp.]